MPFSKHRRKAGGKSVRHPGGGEKHGPENGGDPNPR